MKRLATVVESRGLIDECDVSHCKRFVFCVHQDLMPSVQDDRLVIRMTHTSSNEHAWVSSLSHPMQVTKFRLSADQAPMLTFGQTVRVLVADVNQLSSLANDFFAHVWLSTATCDRLVSEGQSIVDESLVLDGNEEPFALTDERFVSSAVSLTRLHAETGFECSNRGWLERVKRSLHR